MSRELASERRSREGQRKGELATISHKISLVLSLRRREIQLAPFLGPSLVPSREARFARPNRGAFSQVT